jgi:predicted TIM-barrel fold metal-dependent hydrolase
VIVDCHTHIWTDAGQLGRSAEEGQRPAGNGRDRNPSAASLDASTRQHLAASKPVDVSIVLAFKSRYLGANVPNELVADYVRQHPQRLIGFAGVDPTHAGEAISEIRRSREELGLRGITVSPAAQDFHPSDSRSMQVFAESARLRMPVLVDQGLHFTTGGKMEYARPYLLDEVAREFPDLNLVVAHLGHPWIDECVALLGKHEQVYADISGLLGRPWQAYNALLKAYEQGVMDKLLFGSGFPYMSATECIEALYSINKVVLGSPLPTVPRQYLQGIVERDVLTLLGLETRAASSRSTASLLDDHDEERS